VTIGFLAFRKGYLKVMGALVQAALDRGHGVVLLWDPVEPKPGERLTRAELSAWPGARIVEYDRHTALLPVLRAAGVTALVGPRAWEVLRAFGRADELGGFPAAGVRLYSVDYGLDTITSDPAGYRAVDVTFYASAWQRELGKGRGLRRRRGSGGLAGAQRGGRLDHARSAGRG
jgi:hypothetical protein